MQTPASVHEIERQPDEPAGVDLGGDAIARSLRLGGAAVGRSLVFTEAGSLLDECLAPQLPDRAAVDLQPVRGRDGEPLGSLRAVGLAPDGPLDLAQRGALADAAALIACEIETEARIRETDHVSGRPNRRRFEAAFARLAREAGPDARLILVTLADARHYNEILRALGHACAEDFVRQSAAMIARETGPDRPLFHVSVLSFAFLAGAREAMGLAQAIALAFTRPVTCQGLPINTRAGVGLTTVAGAAPRPAELLRAALAAAQDSRSTPAGVAQYDRRSDEAHVRAFTLLGDLAEALDRDRGLSLAYQPRVDLGAQAIAGAEALIRWTHPTLGPVSPDEFVPLAETTALMADLTRWVMRDACRRVAGWRARGLKPRISINVSPANLREQSLLGDVDAIFRETGVAPEWIEFEFTEGVVTSAEPGVAATIDALRARGVTIAIDDFGTGYSNFDSLSRLPADVLKLDRSFVQPLDADPRRRKLVRAMIDLSHDLDFRVVAEGVETDSVCRTLTDWGCDEGQGYFFGRPLTADAFGAIAA